MKNRILALSAILSLAVVSCQNNDDLENTESALLLKSATIATSDVAIESVAQETSYEADFYSEYEHILRKLSHFKGRKGNLLAGKDHNHYVASEMPVVSIDTAAAGYPIYISIDYGDGIETTHGKVISGLVKIEITGVKNTDGSKRIIDFVDCKIDTIAVAGTSTELYNSDNTTTRSIKLTSNVTFTVDDGAVLNRVGNEVRTWTAGLSTAQERNDDVIETSGSVNVTSNDGNTYSKTITKNLIHTGDCHSIVEGVVEYKQNSTVLATLDYGDGTCDNVATLTTGGTITEIQLKNPKAKGGKGHN
jgi:hypothetical protein